MSPDVLDLSEVRGQAQAKRAMEIAAAGGHHILLIGPGRCGKSMLASAFAGLLPPVAPRQRPTAYSEDSQTSTNGFRFAPRPPLVAPFPTSSRRSLIGGHGDSPLGDLARADQGVLVLDDMDRFPESSLSLVRDAVERGELPCADGGTAPARFQLFATLRTCPCGEGYEFCGPCGPHSHCQTDHQWRAVKRYVDIVDLQVMMDTTFAVDWDRQREETSTVVRERVMKARRAQDARGQLNARIKGSPWNEVCALAKAPAQTLSRAMDALSMSGGDCAAVMRVARTLADLEGVDLIGEMHVAEALVYRFMRSRYEQKWPQR